MMYTTTINHVGKMKGCKDKIVHFYQLKNYQQTFNGKEILVFNRGTFFSNLTNSSLVNLPVIVQVKFTVVSDRVIQITVNCEVKHKNLVNITAKQEMQLMNEVDQLILVIKRDFFQTVLTQRAKVVLD